MDFSIIFLVIAVGALALLCVYLALRGQGAGDAALGARMQALNETLTQAQGTMQTRLEASGEKTAEALGGISARLAVIDGAQKNLTDLSQNIIGLQDILSNKQARGAFGEIQMRDLISDLLPASVIDFSAVLSNNKRPDCLLRLATPPGPMAIDAKFPLEAWQALCDAEDEPARAAARKRLAQDVRTHIAAIAEKYIIPGETAESALMFLPSEAVYAELHASARDAVEAGFKARVWIVSPTTMMALLNTLRGVLKDVHMREQAGVIQTEVGKLTNDVRLLADASEKLARHFSQAGVDVQDITTRAERVQNRVQKIQEVDVREAKGDSPSHLPPE